MFEDWSQDLPATYDAPLWPALPSEQHKRLLMVFDGSAHIDTAGRRVVWGYQDRWAARLGIRPRRFQQLVADLRTPERDPRHPNVKPAGRRLGLLKVEPSRRPGPDGRTRYGVNRYVLLFDRGAAATMKVQSALTDEPVSPGQVKAHSERSALHNERTPASEGIRVTTPSATTGDPASNPGGGQLLDVEDLEVDDPQRWIAPQHAGTIAW